MSVKGTATLNERTPMSTIETIDCAKLIRKALKRNFSGIKFSVRSRKYAGGSSIDVSWVDGPTSDRVNAVVEHYSGASFDGMQDLKTHHDTVVSNEDGTAEVVNMGADYVFPHRGMSPSVKVSLVEWFEQESGQTYGDNTRYEFSVAQTEEGPVLARDTHRGDFGSMIIRQKWSHTDYRAV